MLPIAVAVVALVACAVLVVAKVTRIAMARLGLEPIGVLVFFGLAEAPADELAARRAARLAAAVR